MIIAFHLICSHAVEIQVIAGHIWIPYAGVQEAKWMLKHPRKHFKTPKTST
jgi:hypothetical protein